MALGPVARLSTWTLLLIASCSVSVVSADDGDWGHLWRRGCRDFPTDFPTNCNSWTCDKKNCTGDCGADRLPAQAICQFGTWVVTRTCGCKGFPAFHPGCQKWTCDGYTCTGACSWGAPATATCLPTGIWNTTQTCVPPPPVCPAQPPSCSGGVWPDDCSGKSVCTGYCGTGFTGTVSALCTADGWQVTSQCTPVTPGCAGLPSACSGIVWSPRCTDKTYCGSNCMPGYVGYVYSKCVNGQWTPPTGKCTPKTQTCWTVPPAQDNAKAWKMDECLGKASCKTPCTWGCSGSGFTATCVNGGWIVAGNCGRRRFFL